MVSPLSLVRCPGFSTLHAAIGVVTPPPEDRSVVLRRLKCGSRPPADLRQSSARYAAVANVADERADTDPRLEGAGSAAARLLVRHEARPVPAFPAGADDSHHRIGPTKSMSQVPPQPGPAIDRLEGQGAVDQRVRRAHDVSR